MTLYLAMIFGYDTKGTVDKRKMGKLDLIKIKNFVIFDIL